MGDIVNESFIMSIKECLGVEAVRAQYPRLKRGSLVSIAIHEEGLSPRVAIFLFSTEFLRVVNLLLMGEMSSSKEERDDLAKELANIIFGALKAKVTKSGASCSLGIPRLLGFYDARHDTMECKDNNGKVEVIDIKEMLSNLRSLKYIVEGKKCMLFTSMPKRLV